MTKPHSEKATTAKRNRAVKPPPLIAKVASLPIFGVAKQLGSWADSVMSVAGPATDLAFAMAKTGAKTPKQKDAFTKAGAMLRTVRETAGVTIQELAHAVDLSDPALIEQAENGMVALPFEVILRLASVVGRDDPVTFVMNMTRNYNPSLWKTLDALGVGLLVVQAGRERELANIYRANDAARKLSDAEFSQVLEFAKTAFDMAVQFRFELKK
jgi:transcriptional regulator with XRE-family HTH domain